MAKNANSPEFIAPDAYQTKLPRIYSIIAIANGKINLIGQLDW